MRGSFAFPSKNTERLFNEFISRYQELRSKQRQESICVLLLVCLGFCSLLYPLFGGVHTLWAGLFLWGSLILILRKYLRLKHEVQHLFINVNVLYHHFSGRLEVGFCNHRGPCNCAADFKDYAWKTFGISFSNDIIV